MPKKPTGDKGAVRFDGTGGSEWQKIRFSDDKEEVEQLFFDAWRALLKNSGIDVIGVRDNQFDFRVTYADGTQRLMELKEIVLPAARGSPYTVTSRWRGAGELTDRIVDLVLENSDGYAKGSVPLDLLVYPTHTEFTLSAADISRLLPTKLARARPFLFNEIWYVSLLMHDSVVGGRVWPLDTANLLSDDEVAQIDNSRTITFHPAQLVSKQRD